MLRDAFLAFDEHINSTANYRCSDEIQERLGRYDKMAGFIVVDDAVLSGNTVTFDVRLEHSPDGVHWLPKYVDVVGGSSSLAIWDNATTSGARWDGDDGKLPKARYVRFYVVAGTTGTGVFTSARVRLYIALRDRGKRLPKSKAGST